MLKFFPVSSAILQPYPLLQEETDTKCVHCTADQIFDCGSRRASQAYSLTGGKLLGSAHELDAVRLLMSWLWDCGEDEWKGLTVQGVVQASLYAELEDKERVEDHEKEVIALNSLALDRLKRQRR